MKLTGTRDLYAMSQPFVVDLDNDYSSVALDTTGATVSDFNLYVMPMAYYGSRDVLSGCTIAIANESTRDSDIDVDTSEFKTKGIKIHVDGGTALASTNDIVFTVTHPSYGSRNATFTLGGVKSGPQGNAAELYELMPNPKVIAFSRQSNGTLSPASRTLTLTFKKMAGGTVREKTIAETGLTVRYSTSAMPATKTAGQEFPSSVTVHSTDTYSYVYVAAFYPDGSLADLETIPVVKDGANGGNGKDGPGTEEVFIRSKTNVAPTVIDSEDPFGEDSNGKTPDAEGYLPLVYTASGKVEVSSAYENDARGALFGNNGDYGECTSVAKGIDSTWKYEWKLTRSLTAANSSGARSWNQYEGTMTLHSKWSDDGANAYAPYIKTDVETVLINANSDGNIKSGDFTSAAKPTYLEAYVKNGVIVTNDKITSFMITSLSGTEITYPRTGDPYAALSGAAWFALTRDSNGHHTLSYIVRGPSDDILWSFPQGVMKIEVTFSYDGQTLTASRSIPFIVVRQGRLGNTGPQGPSWYPDGIWNKLRRYTRTAEKYPVVEWKDNFWFPAEIGTIEAGEEPSASSQKWRLGDKFVLAIIEAVFADFGKLAAAVFKGNCMMSQYGTRNGSSSNEYQNFDEEDPFNEAKFRPNILLNFLQGYADIRGTIRAENLYHNVAVYYAGGTYVDNWYFLASKPSVALNDSTADINCENDSEWYAKETAFWAEFEIGKYYQWTSQRETEWRGPSSPWFVPCTANADIVFAVPATTNFKRTVDGVEVIDTILLPRPEDFPGKIVDVNSRHYGVDACPLKVGCVLASRMVYAVGFVNNKVQPSGNPAVDDTITITTGKAYRFFSMKMTNTYYWVQLNLP